MPVPQKQILYKKVEIPDMTYWSHTSFKERYTQPRGRCTIERNQSLFLTSFHPPDGIPWV